MASSLDREVKKLPTLRGRTVVNLFYESSTRTLASFELAAKRLSADTMSLRSSGSSVDKGESLKDTASTLSAYDPDVIVVRHPSIGAAALVARCTDASVVNAGDGKHQHPTQALLDLYAMETALGPPGGAARRDRRRRAALARRPLARPGARARRSPLDADRASDAGSPLLSRRSGALSRTTSGTWPKRTWCTCCACSRSGWHPARRSFLRSASTRRSTGSRRSGCDPGQVVMHPGPMNRGVEIDARVADSQAALVIDQVRAGLVVRMAVLYDVLTTAPVLRNGSWRRSRQMLFSRNGRSDSLTLEGRVLAPAQGIDECLRITVTDGVIAGDRACGRERPRHRSGVRRSARPSPHPGPRGRGDAPFGNRRRGSRRILRDPRDAEHGAGRRLGGGARRADRAGARGGGRADGLHGSDQQEARMGRS